MEINFQRAIQGQPTAIELSNSTDSFFLLLKEKDGAMKVRGSCGACASGETDSRVTH